MVTLKASQPLQAIRAIEEKMEKMEEKVEAPVERRGAKVEGQLSVSSNQLLRLGEKVTVSTLNAEGVVTACRKQA